MDKGLKVPTLNAQKGKFSKGANAQKEQPPKGQTSKGLKMNNVQLGQILLEANLQ